MDPIASDTVAYVGTVQNDLPVSQRKGAVVCIDHRASMIDVDQLPKIVDVPFGDEIGSKAEIEERRYGTHVERVPDGNRLIFHDRLLFTNTVIIIS